LWRDTFLWRDAYLWRDTFLSGDALVEPVGINVWVEQE
jgi:hypothetical protein